MHSTRWDIFCRVIDNYGDIGVCWRLARQLAHDYHISLRLWVDDLTALTRIWPEAQNVDRQRVSGIEVRRWPNDFPTHIHAAEVVIEAFACTVPPSYLLAMQEKKPAPKWINLDYLSAEDWVEGCHGLPSIHPATGLQKFFFFPGFTAHTGGVLREKNLLIDQQNFAAVEWLTRQGIQPQNGAQLISLFAYENGALAELIQSWANAAQPVYCCVPAGKIVEGIYRALNENWRGQTRQEKTAAGEIHHLKQLSLHILPFFSQDDYDRLLWACDVNFVRGEDSFVRAQWAGKPFVWQIYPQEEDAHLIKLDAFLDKYLQGASAPLSVEIRGLWQGWNRQSGSAGHWEALCSRHNEWRQHSQNWRKQLCEQKDLAQQLVLFCQQGTTESP